MAYSSFTVENANGLNEKGEGLPITDNESTNNLTHPYHDTPCIFFRSRTGKDHCGQL